MPSFFKQKTSHTFFYVSVSTFRSLAPHWLRLAKAIYPNANTDKLQILSDNKDKSGVYC